LEGPLNDAWRGRPFLEGLCAEARAALQSLSAREQAGSLPSGPAQGSTRESGAGSTPSQPASKRADTLGPCEFPRCSDPKNERPYAVVHCAHKGERLLWCQMMYPTPEHHLLIRSLDTSADNPPTETREGTPRGGA